MSIITTPIGTGGSSYKVAIKDSIDIAGYPTYAGSQSLENAPPVLKNAAIVDRLLEADCEIIGKASMHELAFGVTGINHWMGTSPNPKFPELIPGGSSSGSAAAVAADIADFSIGTDTGGSIRVPACCCGIFGLKPTFGRISRAGILPEASSLDCVGPFSRDMPMLINAMTIIDPSFEPLDTLPDFSIGVLEVSAADAVLKTFYDFLKKLPYPQKMIQSQYFDQAYISGMSIINAETSQAFKHLLQTGKVGEDVSSRIKKAALTSEAEVKEAEIIRKKFSDEIDHLLKINRIIALPTMPDFPVKLADAGDTNALLNITALVRPFNLSGHPAISIPLLSQCGAPVGLQLVTRKGDDEFLCAASEVIAQYI